MVAIAMLMTLARFGEAFLLLRAQSVGLPAALVALVIAAMNLVYAASSYPVARPSYRLGRRGLLLGGFAVLILAGVVLPGDADIGPVMAGVALWGLHMGMPPRLLSTLVADTAPPALRGTAFGVFNLASDVAQLLASVIVGGLWTAIVLSDTFALEPPLPAWRCYVGR